MARQGRPLTFLLTAHLLGAAGWLLWRGRPPEPPPSTPSLPADRVAVGGGGEEVTLYFADPDTALLVPVRRRLDHPAAPETVLQELITGPSPDEKAYAPLPKGTSLLGTSLNEGVLTVNLNRAFQTNFPSSSAETLLAVYSIVNTVTELPGIDKVAFQIEGKPVPALGPLDLSDPFERNPDMILAPR